MALKFPDILEHNNSNLPLVDITELKGNSYPLATLAETGAIPSSKRKIGAIIFVSSSQEFYGFYGQTTSSADWGTASNWRLFSTLSGSFTGSLEGTASYAISASNAATASYVPASGVVGLNLSQITDNTVTASVSTGGNSFTLVSSSATLFSITNNGTISGSTLIVSTISASNTLVTDTITANNITATSASFGYVQTISGSAVIVGQEYIVLNTQTPAARFAGLQIYDSGSNTTSSIVWDSQTNHFIYQNASGSSYNGGGFMSGPRNTGSLGNETYPTLNRVLRGQGGDHLYDSNIIDDDITIKLGINTEITGALIVTSGITGSLLGTASYAEQALTASYALSSTSASYAAQASTASYVLNAISSSYANQAVSSSYAISASNASTASYVPASAVVGLNLNSITTGSVTASVNVTSEAFSVISSSNTLLSISNAGATTLNPRGLVPGLSINGDTIGTIVLQTTGSSGFSITADSNNGFSIYDINDNNTRFYMNDGGGFGLNTTDVTGYSLTVSGSSRFFSNTEISGSLTVINGITGSLYGTASWAINAETASYVPASAVVGLNLSQISTGSITASVSLGSPTAFSIVSASITLLSVDTASLTTIKNLTVTDNLVVNGTASFINTENLLVRDPFILINSGSSALTDSGIVSQYNSSGEGSAFYIEGSDTGTYGRWAVAYGVQQGFVSVTADEYVVTAKKASGAPPAEPTWGGSTNGFGNIYVNSDNGEIFIYS